MSHPGATATDRHRVVIIGSGFGGLTAAKTLKRADVDIKLIARTTHHLATPVQLGSAQISNALLQRWRTSADRVRAEISRKSD
jgi:2-polyprenyl-6-methoxyphenol hydroxylase-like FAD-dependent oxidoreductase